MTRCRSEFSFLLFLLLAAFGIFAVSNCKGQEWTEFKGGRWRSLQVNSLQKEGFTSLHSSETGVTFSNTLSEKEGATNRTLYDGSGVATGDFDGDGRPDIVFAGLENKLELYRNLGDWHFTNFTAQSGIQISNLICRGVLLADINGDGALDLLLSTSGGGVRCWANDGHGHFRDITREAGTASPFASFTMALADVDGNGTLDLYIANNRVDDIRDRGQVQLKQVGGKLVVPASLTNRLVLTDGQLQEYGEPDVLMLNDGQGHFKVVSWTDGTFLNENNQPLKRAPLDWGLTATFRDLNNDGFPDLYVCNDFWTPDRIWLNDGTGKFRAAPTLAFRKTSGSSMGVDLAYLEGRDRPDLFVVDMLSRSPAFQKRQMAAQRSGINLPGVVTNRPQSLRNTFFRPREDGTFEEMANYAGLSASEWAWQPVFLDVDLDGRPDLLITTGHAHDVQDRDAEIKVQARQRNYSSITNAEERQKAFTADLLVNMKMYPSLQTPIVAFRNNGDSQFLDATERWGTSAPGIHHGIALADFDGDGDLDLVVNNLNSEASIFRNNVGAPRVAARLIGVPPNTAAIGARVILRNGAVPSQEQEVVSGGKYLSGSDPMLTFAAGTKGTVMNLEVQWRNGKKLVIDRVRANRLYEIHEDANGATVQESPPQSPQLWFSDVSELLPHSHFETIYDDFQRQPTLPWRLSQLGPGVAVGDLDGDGWEDIVIGTGAGGRLGVFRNDGTGKFLVVTNVPFQQPLPRDTAGLVMVPIDNGRNAILTSAANYEDGLTNTACLLSFEQGAPGFRAVWRDLPSSAGPLALADVDGDGVLELFVGARMQAARWPLATGSVLLRQTNGTWQLDERNSQTLASDQCVSSAVWTDLNGDGFPELVLAGEFAPLRIFRNEHGTLIPWSPSLKCSGDLQGVTNLAQLTGLWTAVSAGDFDGDGKLDIIAGNWGENAEIQAKPARPYILFAAESGTPALSLAETAYDARGVLTPSRSLDDLGSGFPILAGKFRTFHDYSEATLVEVFGTALGKMRRFEANTLKTIILLNRGAYFEVRELPIEAQLAPVFGLSVADFNLDSCQDLFIAQNFFATRPGVPRLDGGRGLLLRGDGTGNFAAVTGEESGIRIYGEQRGSAIGDFDHDGRPDLVVTENGASTRLFKNLTSAKGIRVHLRGPKGNPHGIGSVIRVGAEKASLTAAHEIRAGAGYWSQDAPTLTLPRPNEPIRVSVRWPGGLVTVSNINPGTSESVISMEGPAP